MKLAQLLRFRLRMALGSLWATVRYRFALRAPLCAHLASLNALNKGKYEIRRP